MLVITSVQAWKPRKRRLLVFNTAPRTVWVFTPLILSSVVHRHDVSKHIPFFMATVWFGKSHPYLLLWSAK
ncbi:MAG: hypothetical protein QXN24_08645 [Candidatus Bathyarchaeia archaeon]